MNTARLAVLALLSTLALHDAHAAEWTYRGQLHDGDTPANGRYDLKLQMHDDAKLWHPLGQAFEFGGVLVKEGLVELSLDIPAALDMQRELWVEVSVRGAGEKDYEVLPTRALAKGVAACWSTAGNAGLAASAFLGTSDADPLQLRSNNQRVMQYVATGDSPNIIGGHANNIGFGIGITVAGGGNAAEPHLVGDSYGTIGGGYGNTAGNSNPSDSDAAGATVSGGSLNRAEGAAATVAGGGLNIATGMGAAIAGGTVNLAGVHAAVGGGNANQADGEYATIPGGYGNNAEGTGSFAAGTNARALHNGAFVWSDSSGGFSFSSTAPHQMRLRAAGGLQLQSADVGVDADDLGGGGDPIEFLAEATDAQMYLMSDASGNFGSVVALGEMSGSLVNTWAIARETSSGGNDLRFTFGTNPVAASNTTMVEFRDDGTTFKGSGSATWDVVSDARLKSGVAPIRNALSRLLSLHGVRFEYVVPSLPGGVALPRGEQLGFVAQDVQKVFPEWVGTTGDGYLFVGERGTTALLVEALRELEQRNAQLEARLSALEATAAATSAAR